MVFFYEVLKVEGAKFSSHREKLKKFSDWGLPTASENRRANSHKEVKKRHRQMAEKRDDLDFEIDGMVIKLDNLELRQELGTRQRSPR